MTFICDGDTCRVNVPVCSVPPDWMVGAQSRLLDCWEPQLEWHRLAEIQFSDREYVIKIFKVHGAGVGEREERSSSPVQRIEGCFYDARFQKGKNIAHAIFAALTGLACSQAARLFGVCDQCVVVIPENSASYVRDIYKLLNIKTLLTDGPVEGVQLKTNLDSHALGLLASELLPISVREVLSHNEEEGPRKIFLPRRGARSIRNHGEIASIFDQQGFATIYLEDFPVIEQLRILWRAEFIAGVHGAGLAGIAFRAAARPPRPLKVLELFGPGYVVTLYREMASVLGADWVGLRGKLTADVVEDLDGARAQKYAALRKGLIGRLLRRIFSNLDPSWERTHQSSSFEVDPVSVVSALNLCFENMPEPPPRQMTWDSELR